MKRSTNRQKTGDRDSRNLSSFRFGLSLLFISLALSSLRYSPDPTVPLGPPQTVKTTHPTLGVHTRLTDEVEPWKIKRTLELVREMGSPTIVEFFPWAYGEPKEDEYNWSHSDLVIDHAHTQGLTIIARIGLVPGWARPEGTPLNYLTPDRYADFAEFSAEFAQRYKNKVTHIIIGNEPNLTFEWGGINSTPADYANLLKEVSPAIRAVNSDIVILAGALAPTLEPEGSPNGLNDLVYLQGMYDAGSAEYFDALAVHSYGLTFPPDSDPAPDILNFRRVELIRDIMVANGDAAKEIYITESGYNDHPRWTRAVRPAQRIAYTKDAQLWAETNWPYVKLNALWMFRTPAPTKNFLDYYTFVTPEFIEKPIFTELKSFTGNATTD